MMPRPAITTEYSFSIHWTEVTLGTETEIQVQSFDGLIQKLSKLSKSVSHCEVFIWTCGPTF